MLHVISLLLLAAPVPKPDATTEAIRKLLDDQAMAWNKGDIEGFMVGYWKSPELTFSSGGEETKGWDATYERYRKRYQGEGKEMGKLTFSDVRIHIINTDHAYVRGKFQLIRSKDKPSGLFTLIVKKFPDGWRIVHDHTSG